MQKQRWTCAALSREIGVTYAHLYNAMVGRTPPSPTLRTALPGILDAELADLFTEDALEERFWDRFNGHKNKGLKS